MTAKQVMKFAEQHAYDESFNDLELELDGRKIEIATKLESDPTNRKLSREYQDVVEKLRMIYILKAQRLELFHQAGF